MKMRTMKKKRKKTIMTLTSESTVAPANVASADHSKSGGEGTSPSSPQNKPSDPRIPLLSQLDPTGYHKSGVDTPDRFATPYQRPPPLSQRHLVEALAAAEIDSKEGEVGQRDDIRSGTEGLRIDGAHLIPPGRSMTSRTEQSTTSSNDKKQEKEKEAKTPRARPTYSGRSFSDLSVQASRAGKRKEEICKAKAFAFFGQVSHVSSTLDFAHDRTTLLQI